MPDHVYAELGIIAALFMVALVPPSILAGVEWAIRKFRSLRSRR